MPFYSLIQFVWGTKRQYFLKFLIPFCAKGKIEEANKNFSFNRENSQPLSVIIEIVVLPKIAKECCRKSLSRIKFLDWFVKVIGQFFLDVIGLKAQVALFKLSLVSFD